jgi:cell division protein FtsQ
MTARAARAVPTGPRFRRRRFPAMRRGIGSLRWLMPVVLVGAFCACLALGRMPGTQALVGAVAAAEARAISATAALGLVVTDIQVEGRTTTQTATILAALGATRGTPILAVDPDRARRRLESLPWVRSATIERRLPGTLFVRLVEREPLAIWQHDGKQELIDHQGEVIAVKDLNRFSRLPTVVGTDAARHAAELLAMLGREPALAARVTAAVRIDDRRWNLRIDHRIEVMLPDDDPAAAWAKLARLERTTRLLQRNVEAVDMRLSDRLVLRVATPPAKEAAPAKKTAPAGSRT